MKLKSLAALLFRMLGVSSILTGLNDSVYAISDTHKFAAISAGVSGLLGGVLIIYFSQKLADLFCKGLDDDSV